MNISKPLLLIAFIVLSLIAVFSMHFVKTSNNHENAKEVTILNTWNLPKILEEVSGIAYMGNQKIAAIQDEKGSIFIYNLKTSTLEKEIPFGKDGDYEGITLVETTAYVLKSDGEISRVEQFMESDTQTTVYESPFKGSYNFEGLGYDKNNNRLLIALKENGEKEYRPVYAFDLTTNTFLKDPVFKLHFDDPVLTASGKKKKKIKLYPSEINIHPTTGKLFILEGVNPKLLILDATGNMETLHLFHKKQFPQAEGITFGDNGEMYVSNEGRGGKATILQIQLN